MTKHQWLLSAARHGYFEQLIQTAPYSCMYISVIFIPLIGITRQIRSNQYKSPITYIAQRQRLGVEELREK